MTEASRREPSDQLPERLRRATAELRFELTIAAVLLVVVVGLAAMNLHGSSIGIHRQIVDGAQVDDPDLIAGTPRQIRSDEFLRWTTIVVSQSRQDYPEVNTALRDGVDLTVIYDVPHRGWTAWFEPQHAAYLLGAPLEFAYSFKWYGIAAFSFLAATIFARRFGRLGRSTSVLIGAFWVLSPFFQWWHQSQAFLSGAYAMLCLVLAKAAITGSMPVGRRIVYGLAAGYMGAAGLLLQYPPYLLCVVFPTLVMCVALLFVARSKIGWREVAARTASFALPAVAVIGAVGLGFVIDNRELIQLISESKHPGGRSFSSGQGTWQTLGHMLSGNLAVEFLDDRRATNYLFNQSEAAGFTPLLPILVGVAAVISVARRRRGEAADPALLGLIACSVAIALWLFVPGLTSVFRLVQFTAIPINRMVYMLGMTQFFLLVALLSRRLESPPTSFDRRAFGFTTAGAAVAVVAANRLIINATPGFVSGRTVLVVTTAAVAIGIGLAIAKKTNLGLAILVVLGAAGSVPVNPLYRGLEPVLDTPIVDRIAAISSEDPDGSWAVLGGFFFQNLAVQAGARSISGSTPSTQVPWWSEFYSDTQENQDIVNRSAHFPFGLSETPGTTIELTAINWITVQLDPCDAFSDRVDLSYVVSPAPVEVSCLTLRETVEYQQVIFFIYDRN